MIWNPVIKSLMMLFAISLSFDLLSRTVLAPKIAKASTAPTAEASESAPNSKVPSSDASSNIDATNLTEEEIAEEAEFLINPGDVLGTMQDMYSLEIHYCQNCGYNTKFDEMKEKLENYKNVTVEGKTASKPFDKRMIGNVLFGIQLIGILAIVCNYLIL